jgi:hypothetical protein
MPIILGLLVFLVGCAMTPRLTNTRADVGAQPAFYEQTIREHLHRSLLDPYSVQDFHVSEPELMACMIAPSYPFYGWRTAVQYNAKNAYGGYVGLRRSFYWFHGERLALITADPGRCPEGR